MDNITLVIPAHNEGSHIGRSLAAMLEAAAGDWNLRALVVDDGSCDDTAARVEAAMRDDARIGLVRLTRNFGKEAAISAGLAAAEGDAVIVLDADLQHPPELIPAMVGLWRQGFPVVEAVKSDRGREGWTQRLAAQLFYGLFRRFAGFDLADRCDFKLLDRAVVRAYLALPERRRFFRGLVAWLGYPAATLPFAVAARSGGESRWGNARLLAYAIDNLTAFSALPLRLVTWLGLITLGFGLGIAVIAIEQKWRGVALDGFTTVILLSVIFSGIIMTGIGIIGHYLARIHEEVKGRPIYVLRPEDARREKP